MRRRLCGARIVSEHMLNLLLTNMRQDSFYFN